MEEIVYEIKLTETSSMQIEQAQTKFMSAVFKLAKESGIVGHGLEITLVEIEATVNEDPEQKDRTQRASVEEYLYKEWGK